MRRVTTLARAAATLGLGLGVAATAHAKPEGPRAFCAAYPDAPECMGRSIACAKCHESTQPVAWNSYGGAVLAALAGGSFEDDLEAALAAVEDEDSDGDGLTNLEEIELGTNPGDPLSSWMPRPEPDGDGNPVYDVGGYDPAFAYKRLQILFCGQSPSFEQQQDFAALEAGEHEAVLHEALAECLESDFWVHEALRELANPKIRPVRAYGRDTEVAIMGFKITIADYDWDYRLWQYILTGDRDARELLTAQYHVGVADDGSFEVVEGTIPTPPMLFGGGQPLEPEFRAGMLTTQWNLFLNIMFAAVPRVAAGHAYREYLGLNLSLLEGVRPVQGEPLDIDAKGVADAACAQCHSTLDPLSYAFSFYEGIDIEHLDRTGTYRPERPAERIPAWEEMAPQAVILDQDASSLVEQAGIMANSPEFQRTLAATFFEYAVGHEPQPDEVVEFEALWTSMPADGYSANRLLHRLIDTEAFGAP